MALQRTLSNPAVEVNNSAIGIVPNSLSYKAGKGDITMRPQSAGGDSIEMIRTENAETKKSMVKFKLYNTKTNDDLVRTWQDSIEGNTISLSDGEFTRSFAQMFVVTDPEMALGADGEIEIEFHGKPSL